MGEYEKIAEVEAFMEKLNYFRKPYNRRDSTDTTWVRDKGLAGDRIVKEALDGKGDIGMLMNKVTTFICFDIDTPGKDEGAAEGSGEARNDEGDEPESTDGGECRGSSVLEGRDDGVGLLKADKGDGGSAIPESGNVREVESESDAGGEDGGDRLSDNGGEGNQATVDEWSGWRESGIDGEEVKWRGTWAAIEAMPRAPVVTRVKKEFRRELGEELKEAVRALCECFNEVPSLVRRSPHGCHVYWCFETAELWYRLRPKLAAVRQVSLAVFADRGIGKNIQVLPTLTVPLRIPRKDRLIETASLEPIDVPADSETFWRSLRVYPLEGLIKEEVLETGSKAARRPRLRKPAASTGGTKAVGAVENGDMMSLHPRNRAEAEELLMPFSEGQTNGQLIKMVEGGKREGLTLDDVTQWILGWETRSSAAGYAGDLFDNRGKLEARIAANYRASTATAAGATRFIELWNRKRDEYERNEEAAERAIEALDRMTQQPKQSRKAVRRFLADIEAWERIIDDAAADATSELDETTRRNRARGVYPLPYELLRVMYSGCDRIWKDVQTAGIVAKDEGSDGQYVPDIGRPQYYQITIAR